MLANSTSPQGRAEPCPRHPGHSLERGPSPTPQEGAVTPSPCLGATARAWGPTKALERLHMAFKGVGVPRALVTAKSGCAPPLFLFFWVTGGEGGPARRSAAAGGGARPLPGGLGARPLLRSAPWARAGRRGAFNSRPLGGAIDGWGCRYGGGQSSPRAHARRLKRIKEGLAWFSAKAKTQHWRGFAARSACG